MCSVPVQRIMTGQDRKGQEKTGKDRKGQERTGKDRKGQERTGKDTRLYSLFVHGRFFGNAKQTNAVSFCNI